MLSFSIFIVASDLYTGKSNGAVRSEYFHGFPCSVLKLLRLSLGIIQEMIATVRIVMPILTKRSRHENSSLNPDKLIFLPLLSF